MITETNLVTGLYTLDYCCNSVLADLGLPKGKEYIRFLKWGVDGFRRLNLAGQLPTIKSATLAIDPHTMTARIPDDFVSLIKLGVCCHGHLINFDIDNSLCLRKPNQINTCPCTAEEINQTINQYCGCDGEDMTGEFYNANPNSNLPVSKPAGMCGGDTMYGNSTNAGPEWDGVSESSSWYYPFYSRWHNGQYTAGFYGMGAGFRRGGYMLNLEANLIQFDCQIRRLDEVVLEYVSTGIDETGNAIIPQGAIGAICAYIHERRCLMSKDAVDKQMAGTWNRKWTNEATALVKRNEALSYDEWVLLFRTYNYQTPKR